LNSSPINKQSSVRIDRSDSLKETARKNFKRMTFRRQLSEACGTVWLNARRPSINAELKLLQVKSNNNASNTIKYNRNQNKNNNNNGISNKNNNTSNSEQKTRIQLLTKNFSGLFKCNSK
jgi:hypothetical protein